MPPPPSLPLSPAQYAHHEQAGQTGRQIRYTRTKNGIGVQSSQEPASPPTCAIPHLSVFHAQTSIHPSQIFVMCVHPIIQTCEITHVVCVYT
mmetsp:Transcript_28075/g.70105  ORF Transcript_28075/g.70105 Transcript_28075/m.70105 type:complete len:92 (-) Transcript_28075:181-456(-)